MDKPLAGRVAVVTGASSGLGLHFAKVLAAAGASVALMARRTERLAAGVAEIEATAAARGPSRSTWRTPRPSARRWMRRKPRSGRSRS